MGIASCAIIGSIIIIAILVHIFSNYDVDLEDDDGCVLLDDY